MYLRKTILALTGLFLCIFLVVHLSANFILVLPEETARGLYNAYSALLRQSPLITVVSYFLYASILLHALYALLTTLKNRRSKAGGYTKNRYRENSTWASQNMGLLGVAILLFITVHMANFWARIKLGLGDSVGMDSEGNVDVYQVTYTLFQNPYYVFFYTVLMVPLAYHLHHGLKSAFMTLGFYHTKGLRLLSRAALIYAAVMGVGFGVIPFIVYLK
jgi:succinate dehydrogenase / fumarate reductase cytochrome b subunit